MKPMIEFCTICCNFGKMQPSNNRSRRVPTDNSNEIETSARRRRRLQDRGVTFQNQIDKLKSEMDESLSSNRLSDARYRNSLGTHPIILPQKRIDGVYTLPPAVFATRAELDELNGPQLARNLRFYGLDVPQRIEDRKSKLAKHIGMVYENNICIFSSFSDH
jgi:hypothetical protein